MKKFTYLSPQLEQELKKIEKGIYLKMNGVTADRMREAGIVYRKNYGVSLPELKQMAIVIGDNETLARALWRKKTRETMLLATMLYPACDVDEKVADEWLGDVNTLELAENLSRNLLSRVSFLGSKVVGWVCSGDYWIQATGYFSAAFGIKMLSDSEKEQVLATVKGNKFISEVPVYRSVALFLREMGSENIADAKRLADEFRTFENSDILAERIVYEELKTEIMFRFDL